MNEFIYENEDGSITGIVSPEKINLVLVTKGGESKMVTKVNPNKRHSKNNTVMGFEIFIKDTFYKFYLKDD